MQIYTNGILAATLAVGVPATMYNPATVSVGIGARNDGTGTGAGVNRWGGKIDEVRIYNEVLTDTQIQALPELAQTSLAFTLEPVSVTVAPNSSVTFRTTFTGSLPHYIQWLSNSVPIPGAGKLSYTIPAAWGAMNGDQYRVPSAISPIASPAPTPSSPSPRTPLHPRWFL